jgi:hypothetical protein
MHDDPRTTVDPRTPARRTERPRRRSSARLAGAVLVACSVGLIGAGALATWARCSGTYVELGGHGSYLTEQYALTTDSTDWRATLLGWAGSVRLEVASESPRPIFVGVAAPTAVDGYLRGVAYTSIKSSGLGRSEHQGGAPIRLPARALGWTAHAEGVGTQTLRWRATAGRETAVAMNADGSRSVHVRVESSAVTLSRMPWWVPAVLTVLGWAGLAGGVLVLRRTRSARAS